MFGLLMLLRSVVMAGRDVAVASLQIEFACAMRLRLAERLAATRWEHIVRLRHARVTQLMGDIQFLAAGTQSALKALSAAFILRSPAACWPLLLAPALAWPCCWCCWSPAA